MDLVRLAPRQASELSVRRRRLMFEWLLRTLGPKPLRNIRTFNDLTAAIKAGEIKPHVYRDGDVQVADFFAETGLSPPRTDESHAPYVRLTPIRSVCCRLVQICRLNQNGTDNDDIYSDMPISPMEPFRTCRNRQWLVAFAVTTVVWGALASLYMRSRRT